MLGRSAARRELAKTNPKAMRYSHFMPVEKRGCNKKRGKSEGHFAAIRHWVIEEPLLNEEENGDLITLQDYQSQA